MIVWVERQRRGRLQGGDPPFRWTHASDDDLRRIELCALTTLDVSMFHDMFGAPDASAPEVQDER